MFGHQDDNHDDKHGDDAHHEDENVITPDQPADIGQDGQDDHGAHDGQDQQAQDDGASGAPDVPEASDADSADGGQDQNGGNDDDSWQHPDNATDDSPEQINDIIAPAGGGDHPQHPAPPMPLNARDLTDDGAKTPHELIDIKQKALSELTPLLGQLDQTPEDRFRTLLMIIQASDDQDMVKQAYDAAEDIKDEKLRAQALLDIVNEINYFTQHPAA